MASKRTLRYVWTVALSGRSRVLLSLRLLIQACGAETTFIDASSFPSAVDWLAVLVEDASGQLVESFGLQPLSGSPVRVELQSASDLDRLVLLGFQQADLEGLVRDFSGSSMARPFRTPMPTEAALPRARWQLSASLEGEGMEADARHRQLGSDALLPCESRGDGVASGVFQASCAAQTCVPLARQVGCQLEIDFRVECGAEVLEGRVTPRGDFEVPAQDGWFGACHPVPPRQGAQFAIECQQAGDETCRVEGGPKAPDADLEWEALSLLGAPLTSPEPRLPRVAIGIWPLGPDELVMAAPGRGSCDTEQTRQLLFVSRSALELTRSATVSDCIMQLETSADGREVWGASAFPVAILRMDAGGRVLARRALELEAVPADGGPHSMSYDPSTHTLVVVFGPFGLEDPEFVEYVSFDPDTLAMKASKVFHRPRMENAVIAWGSLVTLDDESDTLRFLSLADFAEQRSFQLSPEHARRNYDSLEYSLVLDRLLIRVSGRYRQVMTVGPNDRSSSVINFETQLQPYALAGIGPSSSKRMLVGFGLTTAPAHSMFGVVDLEGERFIPGLSTLDGDHPSFAYSDEREEAAYVLLRSSAQLLKVRLR